jgi:hypothetical protein
MLVGTVTIAVVPLITGGGSAVAKVPPFTVEVTPPAPTLDRPVRVVVRLWKDAEHTQPGPAWPRFVPGLWAYPLENDGTVDVAGRIKLIPIARGRFRMVDQFRPREAGPWVVVVSGQPRDLRVGWVPAHVSDHGWAGPVFFLVDDPAARRLEGVAPVGPSAPSTPKWPLMVLVGVVGMGAARQSLRSRRRGPSSPVRAVRGP